MRPRLFLRILGLAAAYVLTARLGLAMDAVAGFATLVWAPSGIALAALLRGGRSLWPGVFLGAFVVNVWVGAPAPVALGIATGNTLEAVLGVVVLARVGFDVRLGRVRDAAALLAVALGSTLASATVGVASLLAGGIVSASALGHTWRVWWLGDVIGEEVVAPLLLAWSFSLPAEARWKRVPEGAAIVAGSVAAGLAVFGPLPVVGVHVLFAPLVWAAVRLRQRGGTLVVLAVSACAVAGTAAGHGPFADAQLNRGLLQLQSFMGFVAAVTLLLTAAVAERDQARAVALRAVAGRDDFLAIASHELRTPLSALTLQIGTMRRLLARGGALADDRLEKAERTTDRLSHLVTTLLDVSRIEAGQLRVQPEPMDLASLVRDVADRMADEAARAGCELRVSASEPLHGAWDRLRLEQVLANLLSNAFRYAAGHPVEITLEEGGGRARVAVRDHGAGVAAERIEELFAPYRRGDAARERGGLGLGLYISRHLVEAHTGTLTAVSHAGSGCEFVIELPVRARYAGRDEPAAGSEGADPRRG